MTKAEYYTDYPENDGAPIHWARQPATPDAVDCVLNGDKSPWYFIRLPNGDLVLAVYPQEGPNGTYLQTEQWRTI